MESIESLKGLVCLVTGGAQGIGFATASQCARRGAAVILLDRNEKTVNAAAERIAEQFCVPTDSAIADVVDRNSVEAAIAGCVNRVGAVDILVNCAGIMTPRLAPVSEMALADVEQMFSVHVVGAYLCAKAVLPGMTTRRFGRIINISSVLGTLGLPFRSGYAIAKSAINGFTRSLAVEVARSGVTVNAVAPGYILTETLQARLDAGMLDYATYAERAPAGRWGLAEEVGHLIAFLALPASGFITGAVIAVDGGYTIRGDPGEAIGSIEPASALDAVRRLFEGRTAP
jgi:NAD(P)-dependent dehydrogenase (short-subunit alcohol dehydrogenase family)